MKNKRNTIETVIIVLGWIAAFAATAYLALADRKKYVNSNAEERK